MEQFSFYNAGEDCLILWEPIKWVRRRVGRFRPNISLSLYQAISTNIQFI